MNKIKAQIQEVFHEIAEGLETGHFGAKVSVGLTLLGSELAPDNLFQGAYSFAKQNPGVEVVAIGEKLLEELPNLTLVEARSEAEQHQVMEQLLDSGRIQACVTQHYNFPIGVATVGRVITPGRGKPMMVATTTGTAAAHRVVAMVQNAIAGIIAAKSVGIERPTLGVLNVDGARKVEQSLQQLKDNGYEFDFVTSERADGGAVMRGNDVLLGTPDVLVTDTLTGNILMKMFSSATTGGTYESSGYGYGPGIGEGYERNVLILSRVSGIPVVANALDYAATLVRHQLTRVAKAEYEAANQAGLKKLTEQLLQADAPADKQEEAVEPPKEVTTAQVSGIDIMELEDAVQALWRAGIYAQSGMGCTGPIVLINEERIDAAMKVLLEAGYPSNLHVDC